MISSHLPLFNTGVTISPPTLRATIKYYCVCQSQSTFLSSSEDMIAVWPKYNIVCDPSINVLRFVTEALKFSIYPFYLFYPSFQVIPSRNHLKKCAFYYPLTLLLSLLIRIQFLRCKSFCVLYLSSNPAVIKFSCLNFTFTYFICSGSFSLNVW